MTVENVNWFSKFFHYLIRMKILYVQTPNKFENQKNITEFPRLMWTCHKYTILFTFVCYVFVVVGVVNFPEICQSCYWQWVDCNLLMFCSQWSAHNCCHRHLTSVGLHSTTLFAIYTVFQQEAQLLQRDRARRFLSLNILLSHSRSLKVIRNDTGA